MNSRFRAVIAFTLLVALATPPLVHSGSGDRKRTVRTTAYTHSEADHIKYGRKTALGTQLKRSTSYTSAAADWSRFPVGTTFRMKGSRTNYVIDDYGSALVGTDTIDIYHTSKSAMNRWGVRHVDIEITKWGDYEKSRQILSKRTKYKHCRQMYAAIPQNSNDTKRGWFWNRKPKDKAPAPDPAPAPRPDPQRAPAPASNGDIMLASNDSKRSFGIRSWFGDRDKAAPENIEATEGPVYDFNSTPKAPASAKPEIQRSEPQNAEIMLASNEASSSKSRWQWLRKMVGRGDRAPDVAPAPVPAAPIPAPTIPVQPELPSDRPEPAIMLASHTPERSPIVPAPKPARTAPVSKPTPSPKPAVPPAATQPAPEPAAAPAPATVVLASAKVDTPPAPARRAVEPIAIARTNSAGVVKVSNNAESTPRSVVFAVARPDSSVPHRKRKVRALPAGWKPGAPR